MRLLTAAALAAACALAPAASAQTPAETAPPAGPTKVVFLRECAEPSAFKVAIFVDGDRAASLANHTYTTLDLKPGSHQVAIDWPLLSGQLDLEGAFEVVPGKTNYLYVQAFYRADNTVTRKQSMLGGVSEDDAKVVMADIDAKGSKFWAYCKPPASFYEMPLTKR